MADTLIRATTTARKIGNSTGTILPSRIIREMGIENGDDLEVTVKSGIMTICKVVRKRPKYNLSDLIANTNFEALAQDETLKKWASMSGVGREI